MTGAKELHDEWWRQWYNRLSSYDESLHKAIMNPKPVTKGMWEYIEESNIREHNYVMHPQPNLKLLLL